MEITSPKTNKRTRYKRIMFGKKLNQVEKLVNLGVEKIKERDQQKMRTEQRRAYWFGASYESC